jgi:hypothetical protein
MRRKSLDIKVIDIETELQMGYLASSSLKILNF